MKTYFLIDDDSDDRMIFKESLEYLQLPINYVEAHDGQQALEMIKQITVPDMVFLDLNMPKVGGYEVLVQIKKNPMYTSVPVYMYTTSSNPFDKNRCIQAGAKGFVTKHDSFEDLCRELKNLVDSSQ